MSNHMTPDIANWTAERMRKMHDPIMNRTFMEGGLTPHQYMTKEIVALLTEARCQENEQYRDWSGQLSDAGVRQIAADRIAALKKEASK